MKSQTNLWIAASGGGDCTNDGNEEQGPGGNKRRGVRSNVVRKYRLASGGKVIVPDGAHMDQTALRVVPINETLWKEQTASHNYIDPSENSHNAQYDYMLDNLKIQEDRIVEELSG